jgi:hypothetical protein
VHEPFAAGPRIDYKAGKHPKGANAVLGEKADKPDIVIATNGGSDLLYLPQPNAKELAPKIVTALLAQDYVSGIFVDESLGKIKGTLPLQLLRLAGSARTPRPSIAVNFRSYTTGCGRPLYCAAVVADTTLKQGQGHHGSLSRSDTANFMAAVGPAFKAGFVSRAPVSNADVAPTLAQVLGFKLRATGTLSGRPLTEVLKGGKPVRHTHRTIVSERGANGLRTILNLQYVGSTPYFDAAGFPERTVGLTGPAY